MHASWCMPHKQHGCVLIYVSLSLPCTSCVYVCQVLHHDSSTAAAISNEVNLIMSFRHPNIIAAYYFVTWSRATKAPVQDTRNPDQVYNSDGTFSPAHSTQQLLYSGGPARGPFSNSQQLLSGGVAAKVPLEPLVEAPSGSGTHQSSAAALASTSAGALLSGSSGVSSGATATSLMLRASLGDQFPQQPDAGAPCGAHMQAPVGCTAVKLPWSSAQGTYSTGNSSGSNIMHSAGSSSGNAGVMTGSSPRGTDTQPSSSRSGMYAHPHAAQSAQAVRCVLSGLGAAGDLQQEQPPQQQFLPVLPAHRSPSSDSAAGRGSQSSGGEIVPSGSVQLFPFTTQREPPSVQLVELPHQQQRRPSASVSEGIAYEVSVADSSMSASGAPAACSSSAGAGTSASLIPAAYGAHQQHHQQQVPQQRFVAVLSRDSPSPVGPQQSYSTQSHSQSRSTSQQQAAWLHDTCSTSPGPSGNKLLGKQARSADEAQTWLITELMDGGTLLDLLAPGGQLGPEVATSRRLVSWRPACLRSLTPRAFD